MEEKNFLLFIEKYNNFKDDLNKKLNNPPSEIESADCYIIDDSWLNELLLNYEKYKENKNIKKDSLFPKYEPIFFQDLYEVNSKISNITIINNELLNLINDRISTNTKMFIYYLGGYKKILIEDPGIENYVLTLNNPLDKLSNNEPGILILINEINKINIIKSQLKNEFEYKIDNNNNINNINIQLNSELNIKLKIILL